MTSSPDLKNLLSAHAGAPKWRKRVVVLVALAALGFGGYSFFGTKDAVTTYKTALITQGALKVTVAASGTLQPTNLVTVGSELSGIIDTVFVDENDTVKAGQILAQLDPSKLKDAITKSEAVLTAAKASVAQAKATAQQTKATLARQKELYRLSGGKMPSKIEMDSADASYARAVADQASAEAAVAQAEATLSSDKTNLEKASIRSPIDGVVLTRKIEPGQTVAASLSAPTLFEIAENLGQMELQVNVDEADVGSVTAGQQAIFTVDAYPVRDYPATITRVSYGAQTTDNVVTYKTLLTVDNADLSLRPGMTANATITTKVLEGVLLVPNAALRFSPPVTDEAAAPKKSLISSLMPRMPSTGPRKAQDTADAHRTKTIWTLEGGTPKALEVDVLASDGSKSAVAAADGLKVDLPVIISSSTK